MFRDSLIAAIRTGVAFIVTWLIAKLLGLGVEIDTDTAVALQVALFGVAIACYNVVVSLLERKVNPYFGILLGIPKAPAYGAIATKTHTATPTNEV